MRIADSKRQTRETDITLAINLDGRGKSDIDTGVGFLDHMLEQIARHGKIDLDLAAKGDLAIDAHHTVEDCGLVFGATLAKALGDKVGITRYATTHTPMDEALTMVAIDISGRSYLNWQVSFTGELIGDFPTELIREWFEAFSRSASITLHVVNLYGSNNHHIAESCFKGLALALRKAIAIDSRSADEIPSSKGYID